MDKVQSKSYSLRTDTGHWLGQIVLTSDGLFASTTDYGNLSYAWRSTGESDFRKFMAEISVDYFGTKLYTGISYMAYGKKFEKFCERFAEKILPPLQEILKQELSDGIGWTTPDQPFLIN